MNKKSDRERENKRIEKTFELIIWASFAGLLITASFALFNDYYLTSAGIFAITILLALVFIAIRAVADVAKNEG